MPGLLGILALIVGLNALFVLMEYALVRSRTARLEALARRGDPLAARVQGMISRLEEHLAAIQVGITVLGLALGAFAEPQVSQWLGDAIARRLDAALPPTLLRGVSVALALGILSFVQIVVGELVPRTAAIHKAETIARLGAIPLQGFAALCRPAVVAMAAASGLIARLLGIKAASAADTAVSEEEMRILMGETHEKGSFPFERLMLIENLFDLGQTRAQEAMTTRDKIAYLSLSRSWEENLATIRARRFSRYPLCEDDLDSVVGFVHVKDLTLKPEAGSPPDLKHLRRDIPDVREDEPLEKLLKTFPDKGVQMAVVRDSMGRVLGLITLEDIVEELIGEVHDEYDLPQAWSLSGKIVAQACAIQLLAASPQEAIVQLVERLCAAAPGLRRDEVLQAVLEREKKFSSAVGKGVAVPHARLPSLEKALVAVGRFAKPVPFQAPDGAPVRLVFLILTPAAVPVTQLKVLGRIAALLSNENLRRKLLRAKTAESLLETLRTADTLLAA